MQHISATPFGRRQVDHGLLAAHALAEAPAPIPCADKWRLFDDLRVARAAFGLSDRDLTVLNALLSFLPERDLADGADLIVFPSNISLTQRAHGMAESTLRRHLAALVRAGMIARNDSPNGKRYATRDAGGDRLRAFGFSLRPMLVRAPAIAEAAEALRAEDLRLHLQRETLVLRLRDASKLLAHAEDEGLIAPDSALARQVAAVRRGLRRQMDADLLEALSMQIEAVLKDVENLFEVIEIAEDSIGNAAHFGRHYHNSNTYPHESEPCPEKGKGTGGAPPALPLTLVVKACPDLETYARQPIRSWADLVAAAIYVRAMMGISPDAWAEAERVMGAEVAAVTLAAILQKMGSIRSPGGYLRHLTSKAAAEGFSPGPMIMALLAPANSRAA